MTWARYLETGSGITRFRLQIEGLPYEFVTDEDMERALSGSTTGRLVGLKRESLVGGEEVHPGTAELEQDVMNVRIVETQQEEICAVLAYRPSVTTWLTAELSAAATSVEVESTSGFVAGDRSYIGTECMGVSAVVDADTLTVARGLHGSAAQRHVIGDGEARANPQVTNRPIFIEGRRARLYAYGQGDSPTGDGTQIWLGVCQTDARLDSSGCEWEIQIAGIWQITEQDLGADLATPKKPRGIYYPWSAPLTIYLAEGSSTAVGSATTATDTVHITGFWETQDEFCAAVTAAIAAATPFPAGSGVLIATHSGGHWYFQYTTGATARWPLIRTFSTIDINMDSAYSPLSTTRPEGIGTVGATTAYQLHPPYSRISEAEIDSGKGEVPRGALGAKDAEGRPTVPAESLNAPSGVMPLDGDLTALEATGTVTLQATTALGVTIDGTVPYLEVMATATGGPPDIDDVSHWLQLDPTNAATNENALADVGFDLTWTPKRLPELRFVRTYFYHGSVDDLRAVLVAGAADEGNTGTWPYVTSADFETWTSEVAHYAQDRALVTQRVYSGSEASSLRELLTEEFKLLGVFPIVTTTGTIDVQGLRLAAPTEPTDGDLDASNVLVDGQRPSWERNALGLINTVRLLTGWNPRENEHQGATYVVRDVGSYSLRKATRELEIAPRSALVGGDATADPGDFTALTQTVLGVFGRDYVIVELEAPMTCFEYVLGTLVSLSFDSLPDWNSGARGIEDQAALVIGRRWDLHRGRVTLKLLLSAQPVAGYTPTLTLTAKNSGTDGTVGPFNFSWSTLDPLATGSYLADGDAPTRHWAVGSVVFLSEWDATVPTQRFGTISSFTQSTDTTGFVTITFTFAFTWVGASKWVLRYPTGSTAGIAAAQARYCYLASSDAIINFASLPDISARTFAP